jgi:hypothetical protein
MVAPPLDLLCSQETFRQNSLLHVTVEAVGEIGTAVEAAACFLLLPICDNLNVCTVHYYYHSIYYPNNAHDM